MSDEKQYSQDKSTFRPVGSTIQVLPAGTYQVRTSYAGPYIQSISITHDEIIDTRDSESALVINEIRKFWTLKEKFKSFGMLYKRGIILHGPPGTGKTSVTNIVANEMVKNGCIVLYPKCLPDDLSKMMAAIRSVEPDRSMLVVIEDIDNYILSNEEEMLSLLDGQDTVANVVYLATTNNINSLPDRIVRRPSRFDRIIEIGYPSENLRKEFIKNKIPNISNQELSKWIRKTKNLSIAQIKELVIAVSIFDGELESEVKRIKTLTFDDNVKDDLFDESFSVSD